MAWSITSQTAGAQAIADVDTVQRHAWGKEVDASDPTYGAGKFAYVKGVSGGFVGAVVLYSSSTGLTILSASSGVTQSSSPVGVMMSALDATTKFGWVQIGGDAIIKKDATILTPATTRTDVFLSGTTAGRISGTSVASRRIMGARRVSLTSVLAATSTAVVNLNRPHIQSAP